MIRDNTVVTRLDSSTSPFDMLCGAIPAPNTQSSFPHLAGTHNSNWQNTYICHQLSDSVLAEQLSDNRVNRFWIFSNQSIRRYTCLPTQQFFYVYMVCAMVRPTLTAVEQPFIQPSIYPISGEYSLCGTDVYIYKREAEVYLMILRWYQIMRLACDRRTAGLSLCSFNRTY